MNNTRPTTFTATSDGWNAHLHRRPHTTMPGHLRGAALTEFMLLAGLLMCLLFGWFALLGPLLGGALLAAAGAAVAGVLSILHAQKIARAASAFRKTAALWPERARTGETHRDVSGLLGSTFANAIPSFVLAGAGPDLSNMEEIVAAKLPFATHAVPKFFASEGFNARPCEHVLVVDGTVPRVVQPLFALPSPDLDVDTSR